MAALPQALAQAYKKGADDEKRHPAREIDKRHVLKPPDEQALAVSQIIYRQCIKAGPAHIDFV